jgi:glutamine synthetase
MKVYQAINAVQTELAKVGISKNSRNSQGAGYNFRGIDAVYNVLSSIMAEKGLCIIPRMLVRTCEERISKAGGALFYVTVEAEFDLVSAEDGSKHTARTFGEAMDSGDKATNKAMSAAYKYMAFQTFAIPTEGENDADHQTHEVATKKITLDAKRLGDAIQRIKEGKYTTIKLRETFALTKEQDAQVIEALSKD